MASSKKTESSNAHNGYVSPLLERYVSKEMSYIFSPNFKFSTWRKLWITLAQSQKQLGLSITDAQISQMKQHCSDINYTAVRDYEKKTRHDVMAHILAFGDVCPKARPIIHLGATSAYVGDNTDLVQIKEASTVILRRIAEVIHNLKKFALAHKAHATLGFTHFQPAQLTTVGKRATLWMQDLAMDFTALESFVATLPFLGVKGTTGTQASFLNLFNGNHAKVKKLDLMVTKAMGFSQVLPVAGQTYTRKIDYSAVSLLSGLAQSLHKMANDVRLLQHLKEVEEPFEKGQIGSSAMAYKRNPMRSERLTALARFVISLCQSPAMTAAEQWFERTLDDSANKRLSIPESFLAADAMLIIAANITDGLVVYPKVIEKHIREELPFMATENIIMESVKRGGDRQTVHGQIRVLSMEAAANVKQKGGTNDLLERIAADPSFNLSKAALNKTLSIPEFVGRAPQQTVEFVRGHIDPLLKRAARLGAMTRTDLKV